MSIAPETVRLYDLADELYRLAPWDWMEETDLIAVRLPDSGELVYVSIMGQGGEHRALSLYLGEDPLGKFNRVQSESGCVEGDVMRLVLESRQLQLSFKERRAMEKTDMATIKGLGRKYRGENWPGFQSYHPGWAPGPLTPEETAWLTVACEQLMVVALRLKKDGGGTIKKGGRELQILCREQQADGSWKDVWLPFKIVPHVFPSPQCNEILAAKVAKHTDKARLECLFNVLPNPVGPRYGERTYPYLMLVADADTGILYGMDLLSVDGQSFDEMIAAVPNRFLAIVDKARVRPLSIDCASIATCELLHSPACALKISVECYECLPLLESILDSIPM